MYVTTFTQNFVTAKSKKAMQLTARPVRQLWLRLHRKGNSASCIFFILAQLTSLMLPILSDADVLDDSWIFDHGIIKSANYQENYAKNSSGLWVLVPKNAADIFLQIHQFSTGSERDVLVIADGYGFLLLLYGHQQPRNFTISSSLAVILFDVYGDVADQGFEIEFSSIARSQVVAGTEITCGGTMVGYGIIKPPSYPQGYSNNVSCHWTLRAYNSADIYLQMRHFSMDFGLDFVHIIDASGFKLSLTGKLTPRNYTLASPAIIAFIADGQFTVKGFEIKFSSVARSQVKFASLNPLDSVCGGTIVGHGIIESPNYPENYYNNVSCTWTLMANATADIFLQIHHFSTELGYDFMLISDASRVQHSLSGKQQPINFTLSSPAIISFLVDGDVTAQGFEMEFTSIARFQGSDCGGAIIGYGTIKSPTFQESYSTNVSCLWTLQSHDDGDILLQILHFSTESGYESVLITDSTGFRLRLSGQQPQRDIRLASPANVSLITDSDVTANGFEIKISSVAPYQGNICGGTIIGYGVIRSPTHPANYSKNVSCFWTLRAYDNPVILLQILSFSTKSQNDFVLISDTSGVQLLLSGRQQPRNVTMSSPASILYKAVELVTDSEFEMKFSSIKRSLVQSKDGNYGYQAASITFAMSMIGLFGTVVATIKLVVHVKRYQSSKALARRRGSLQCGSEPSPAHRSPEPESESTYASSDNLGVERHSTTVEEIL